MPLIELGVITAKVADMALDKAFRELGRSEAAIRARRRLGLADRPDPHDFDALYRHALVEWGVFKPAPVLNFFRDQRLVDAFRRAYESGDFDGLQREVEALAQWAAEWDTFGRLEIDPRGQLAGFMAVFEDVLDQSRTPADARYERAATARLDAILEALHRLDRPAPPAPGNAPQTMALLVEIRDLLLRPAPAGDIHLSGQFNNSILNLLSNLHGVTQSVGPAAEPLPPLDEHGRPPLPAPQRDLPPHSRLDYDRNPLFTGREEALTELARRLLYDPAGAPAVISTAAGGMGKTQLAVEFAHRYGRFFAGGVQWVSFGQVAPDAAPDDDAARAIIAAEVAGCGRAMGLWAAAQEPQLTAAEKTARTRAVWAGPTPRLLIFDNCENQPLLAAWRPQGGGARVLVTSRDDTWPAGFAVCPLPTLPRDQSRALLRRYLAPAGRAESDDALDAVAHTLDDLPLALTLAGSALAAYPSLPVAAYLAELAQPDLLRRLLPDDPQARPHAYTRHELDVARTFAVSFDRLRPDESRSDADALGLLAGAARLAPGEPFPRALLLGLLPGDDPRRRDRALTRLRALGLLERAEGDRLRLHRLLALFVGGALAGEMAAAQANVEKAVIALAYEQNIAGDPRPLRAWEGHLRHVTDAAAVREDDTAATLCANFGYYLQMSGDLAGARPYLERALAIRERVLGPEHPDTAQSLNNLGFLLKAQGDLAGARPYYERALGIYERVLGPEHPDTALALNNLGALLDSMGDLAGARPFYERALAIRERVLGPEHPDTATSLNNLGALLRAQGDLAGARPYYERALAISKRVLGPEHPDTAQSLNNLGGLLQAQGDLAGARPQFERALAIRERVLGPEHPDTAQSLNNLGVLCYYEGNFGGAAGYMRRALAVREKVLGSGHPDTHRSRANLEAIEARLR